MSFPCLIGSFHLSLIFNRILEQEKQNTSSQLIHVQQQISDLAYGNYRIYADAGSTTEHCRQLVRFNLITIYSRKMVLNCYFYAEKLFFLRETG